MAPGLLLLLFKRDNLDDSEQWVKSISQKKKI